MGRMRAAGCFRFQSALRRRQSDCRSAYHPAANAPAPWAYARHTLDQHCLDTPLSLLPHSETLYPHEISAVCSLRRAHYTSRRSDHTGSTMLTSEILITKTTPTTRAGSRITRPRSSRETAVAPGLATS
jgi:hypothetical protein